MDMIWVYAATIDWILFRSEVPTVLKIRLSSHLPPKESESREIWPWICKPWFRPWFTQLCCEWPGLVRLHCKSQRSHLDWHVECGASEGTGWFTSKHSITTLPRSTRNRRHNSVRMSNNQENNVAVDCWGMLARSITRGARPVKSPNQEERKTQNPQNENYTWLHEPSWS